jgi:hypothetical protein
MPKRKLGGRQGWDCDIVTGLLQPFGGGRATKGEQGISTRALGQRRFTDRVTRPLFAFPTALSTIPGLLSDGLGKQHKFAPLRRRSDPRRQRIRVHQHSSIFSYVC